MVSEAGEEEEEKEEGGEGEKELITRLKSYFKLIIMSCQVRTRQNKRKCIYMY